MLWAFVASPVLNARLPPRVSRHAPPRSQLSVSIFDLVAGQDDTRLAELPALCKWVDDAGGDGLVAVEAESTPDHGLGLRTTQAVRRGDVLLSVPTSLALSAEAVLRSSIGQWLVDFDPWLADYAFVSVALINERRLGEQSELAPWLRSALLPDRPDVPLLWPAELQAELKVSTTAPFESRLAEMRDDFAWLQENVFDAAPVVFPAEVFSWEAYVEAHALAFSRCCILASKDAVRPALLPLLDLANHAAEPSARVELVEAKAGGRFGGKATPARVDLVATSDLPAGAEVCVRYGGETPGDLLVDYGFADSRAPPLASLEFEIDEDDANYDDKCDLLENEAGLAVSQPWMLSALQPEPPPELMAVLRLRHMDGSDAFLLEGIFRQVLWPEHLQLPVSRGNEEKALQDAIDRCNAAVAGFTGSMQKDLGLLAEAEPGTSSYQLATVRYAERRALEASARWFEAALERLGELEYYQERRLRNLGLEPIETAEELDALRAENLRAGGRKYEGDVDW